mgnify:CR=1
MDKLQALNSTIHGIEILYQTAPNHGNNQKGNATIRLQRIIFSWQSLLYNRSKPVLTSLKY